MTTTTYAGPGLSQIERFNQILADRLGYVCSGTRARFQWRYAPDEPMFFYDKDDRTLLKKSWADAPAPDGGTLGRVWLIAGWKDNCAIDNMGYAPQCDVCEGRGKWDQYKIGVWQSCPACHGEGRVKAIRIAGTKAAGYSPYFETALAEGRLPTEELNQNYVWAIGDQLARSTEHDKQSFENYMTDEKSVAEAGATRDKTAWRETAMGQYDQWTGAMGNLEPGARGGYLSMPSTASDFADI